MSKTKNSLFYTRGDRVAIIVAAALLVIIGIIVIYPLIYIVLGSFSQEMSTLGGKSLIPKSFSLKGYLVVFRYDQVWIGYANSLIYTALYTIISLIVTICAAYPLSLKDLVGKKIIMFLFVFTMYFGGGLIPTYLLIKDLHMLNTMWALIIPGAMGVYNMIIMRTYFMSQIPEGLREASEIDGCGHVRYVVTILLPLSGPIIAVVGLYCAVGMWNSYFDALIYIHDRAKHPLQLVLRQILIVATDYDLLSMDPEKVLEAEERASLMKYSLIILGSLPMIILFPFVQKYFVKGIMIGSLKG